MLLIVLWLLHARGRAEAAGPRDRGVCGRLLRSRGSFCEFFREPDPQLGFLWGGLTMGMLLSVPLMLAGIALIVAALTRAAPTASLT